MSDPAAILLTVGEELAVDLVLRGSVAYELAPSMPLLLGFGDLDRILTQFFFIYRKHCTILYSHKSLL